MQNIVDNISLVKFWGFPRCLFLNCLSEHDVDDHQLIPRLRLPFLINTLYNILTWKHAISNFLFNK